MGKYSWFDRLLSLAHLAPSDSDSEGLVLSGGGSRASFHIGALRYLYDICHIAPTSMVGTSAGSIVASMLAQSSDPAEQSRALDVLERYWLAMSSQDEMFAEQYWFTKLREQWDDLAGFIPEVEDAEAVFVDANVSDPEQVVKEALNADPSTGNDFSLSMLWGMLGSLGRIGRVGATLATSLRGAERAASAYRPGPIVYRLLFESGFSRQAVRDSGVQLRMAFVGLNSGELRFMRQDGVVVDDSDQPVTTNQFDLSLGIWASCALPGIFRPVKLGDEMYVDGGVRDNVPVEMSVTNLGVTRPYVISSTPAGVSASDFEARDMVSIMSRSFSILLDETVRDEIAWARRAGATVIEPLIDVHSSLTIRRGLLRINRDYGWMRAAEEITGAGSTASQAIIEARLALYHLQTAADDQWREHVLAGAQSVDSVEVDVAVPGDSQGRTARGLVGVAERAVRGVVGVAERTARNAVGTSSAPVQAPSAAERHDAQGSTSSESHSWREPLRSGEHTATADGAERAQAILTARSALRTTLDATDPALLPPGHESWPDEVWDD
ncbi:MAG: patatin-like phospholipase family protein [Propionibacteriaceae bacterium]|nr:patatin-like phospholipase family protein [Propionibacteriaceae bacterium]